MDKDEAQVVHTDTDAASADETQDNVNQDPQDNQTEQGEPVKKDSAGSGTLLTGSDQPPATDTPTTEVPAKYDIKFDDDVILDEGAMDKLSAEFREAGYTNAQAQKAVDMHLGYLREQQEQFAEDRKGWIQELRADKEFGGDQFNATVSTAATALRKFDTDGKVTAMLAYSGLGDHADVIRLFARIGRAMSEDQVHTNRDNGKTDKQTVYERIYGADGMGPKQQT